LKQIEKIEVADLAASSRRAPLFRFEAVRASGRDVLEVSAVSKAYGDKQVLRDVSLTVRRGERVAVIGPNGLGKSTLLKIVMDRLSADEGKVRFGHEVRVGYFAQDHRELLPDAGGTPLEYIWEACPDEATTYVRGQLGRVLLSGEDVDKSIGSLSGGEAARLIFCRISTERPNVLVLDEPTNHLDIEAIGALAQGLKAFEGTVLFVSHDRAFVSEIATRILEVTPKGFRDFPGTYSEYLARCGDDHLDADAVVLKAKVAKATGVQASPAVPPESGLSWEEQKRRRNRLAALPARRDKVLEAIGEAEARRKEILKLYGSDGFFLQTPKDRIEALEREDGDLAIKIDQWTAEWESIETELGAL
jgi:ABC-type multidrug transport system ATPase subunit